MALRHKSLIIALAATLALGFASDTSARVGGGFSFGSRGARTFSAPSATPTAPRGAAPFERSMTSPNANILGRPSPYASGSFFSGGFGRGLLGGFIGAGLFGLLFGHGLFGGLGGGLSILGLLLQLGFCTCCSNSSWVFSAAGGQPSRAQAPIPALLKVWGKAERRARAPGRGWRTLCGQARNHSGRFQHVRAAPRRDPSRFWR